jgi:hypothetical protein
VSPGGTGGVGGVGGITGGAAGTGKGATMNINRVQNLTNNMYVCDVPAPFSRVLSHHRQCEPGPRVEQIPCVDIFQAE